MATGSGTGTPAAAVTYYGTVAEVAQLRTRYTASGSFSTATNPTAAAVAGFLDRGSAIIDTMLSTNGFSVPVTAAAVVMLLDQLAIGFAVDMSDIANSAGRFYDEKARQGNPQIILMNEIKTWIAANASGIERMGATRTYAATAGLLFRDTDNSGDASDVPLFPIEAFGAKRTDWDAET